MSSYVEYMAKRFEAVRDRAPYWSCEELLRWSKAEIRQAKRRGIITTNKKYFAILGELSRAAKARWGLLQYFYDLKLKSEGLGVI